ncbi:MAG TPA: FtsX-like permease family protein [Thermohalobaculum sp.]|nr:FtsX-like permease family protein [Thermohalobaculum sp.]
MPFWLKLGLRELRGGLSGFRVFLLCLALGVGGVAAVGSVVSAIEHGLAAQGREILGGDVAVEFSYRFATAPERAWLDRQGRVSEVTDLRSMLDAGGDAADRALVQVKGVDAAYPLYGAARLEGGGDLQSALALRDGVYGLVADPVVIARLGIAPGARVTLGGGSFELRGALAAEPDQASARFLMGPRVIVQTDGLLAAGLLGEGTLFSTAYRVRGADVHALRLGFESAFPNAGGRWRDTSDPAPGARRVVDRLGSFLVLTGLAALAVGGVGVGAAVQGYLGRKTRTIAALRTIGAGAGEILAGYSLQIGAIAGLGILAGLVLGGGAVLVAGPMLAERLPVPAEFGLYPRPLALAALYGALTAALFTLWPLARLRELRPAVLFRETAEEPGGWPRPAMLGLVLLLALVLVATVIATSGEPGLAAWVTGAVAAGFAVLRAAAWGARAGARRLAHAPVLRHRPGLRLALGAIGAPGGQTGEVVLALGLGLGVLAAIGQIDANMQRVIRDELPQGSPAFFFVDIQQHQLDPFRELIAGIEDVGKIDTAPMMRGIVTHLNGVPAAEAKYDPDAGWVLRGDRGLTYSAGLPDGATVIRGDWWPQDYSGPPLVSFAEEEAGELGLDVGSTITVNVLGRPLTARVANLRPVVWGGLGINFLMVFNPSALAGSPHGHIATVHAEPDAEAPVMRATARAFPNVTAIRVRTQVERFSKALEDLGAATRWAALALFATGLAVLVGAAGTAAQRQTGEAAVLKVLGASRSRILGSFALRAGLMGALAGGVALIWGTAAAWGATRFVLHMSFVPEGWAALVVVAGGAALNLLAGMAFAMRPLSRRPAGVLRQAAG